MAVKAKASITLIRINDADSIEIGGRNLIRGSESPYRGTYDKAESESVDYYITYDDAVDDNVLWAGLPSVATTRAWLGGYINLSTIVDRNNIVMGTPLVASIRVMYTQTPTKDMEFVYYRSCGLTPRITIPKESVEPNKWFVVSFSFIADEVTLGENTSVNNKQSRMECDYYENADDYSFAGTLYFAAPKLEKGNRPSDWTPAPEDTDQKLDDQKVELQSSIDTAIETSEDGIINTVTETFTTKDDFQTEVGLLQTQLTQTQEDFTFQFNTVNSSLTDLDAFKGEAGTQLDTISKYIRFLNGDILLGGSDSDVQLKIENDRIAFLDNNNEVMYISNEELYIMRAIIATQLTIGNFSWVPRSNGNVSFRYIGD